MAAWKANQTPLPAWGDLRRFDQPKRSSLSVLEDVRSLEASEFRRGATCWDDLEQQRPNTASEAAFPSLAAAKEAPSRTARQPPAAQRPEEAIPIAQAQLSKPDVSGQIRCQGCGRVYRDHRSLAHHLRDKHAGFNSPSAPGSTNPETGTVRSGRAENRVSLADLIAASSAKAPKKAAPRFSASGLSLTAKQLKNVRSLAKAYPTKAELAKAIRSKLAAPGTKKLSRLKRVILRERTDKAATAAEQAAASAAALVEAAQGARAAVLESFKNAEEMLRLDQQEGNAPVPGLITQVQVLEMAFVEAERRVSDAQRKARLAEEEVAKAKEARAKAWKVSISNTERESVEAGDPEEAALEALVGLPEDAEESGVDRVQPSKETPMPGPKPKLRAIPRPAIPEPRSSEELEGFDETLSSDADPLEGLQGFENVLASWLHDAHQKSSAAFLGAEEEIAEELPESADEGSETASDADSDQLGPDGWDDVLSAWMTNAGVLGPAQHSEPVEPDAPPARPRDWSSPKAAAQPLGAVATAPKPAEEVCQAPSGSDPIVIRQPSGFEAVISPTTLSTATGSPPSAGSLTPKPDSLSSLTLGSRSEMPATPTSWIQDRLAAGNPRRAADPVPLLAEVLSGRGLSSEALLDLRVSMAESMPCTSGEDVLGSGLFVARAAGGGAVSLPGLPSRHSDLGLAQGRSVPRTLRQMHSWGPWAGSEGSRWQEGSAPASLFAMSIPQETQTDHYSRASTPLLGNVVSEQLSSPRVDLFAGAARVGAMADLGLPKRQSADSHVHGSKLYHNVLTAAQLKMLEDLPAPKNGPAAPGERPLARLPSITGSSMSRTPTKSALETAAASGRTTPGWLAASSDEDGEVVQVERRLHSSQRSASLPARQPGSQSPSVGQAALRVPEQGFHQQQFFGHMHPSPKPFVEQPSWQLGPDWPLESSSFQGFLNTGSAPFQGPAARFAGHSLLPDPSGPTPFWNSLGNSSNSADGIGFSHMSGMGQQAGADCPFPMSANDFVVGPAAAPPTLPWQGHAVQGQLLQPGMAHEGRLQAGWRTHYGSGGGGGGGGGGGDFRALLGGGADLGGGFPERMMSPGWDGTAGRGGFPPAEQPLQAAHEFHCDLCRVTCCGMANFQQHCASKKHLRKVAAAGAAAIPEVGSPAALDAAEDGDGSLNPTYVGLQAQCRTYCKQVITTDLNKVVVELLQHLLFWQERSKAVNIHNAARKKRLVSGLREVAKAIKLRKAKTVIVTPNIEQIETEGGLDELLQSILQQAEDSETPVVFALSRKKLGQVFGCRKKMSAIAILDFGGAESLFKEMEQLAAEGRRIWERHVEEAKEETGRETSIQETPRVVTTSTSEGERTASEQSQAGDMYESSATSPLRSALAAAGEEKETQNHGRIGTKQLNVQAPMFYPRG